MVADTSLANLQPGNRKGSKNKITKAIAQKLVEYLDEDFETFIQEIGLLAPRDRVAAKLKLYDMVLPKKQEVEVEAIETAKWEITRASATVKVDQTSASLVEEARVVDDEPEAESEQLRLPEAELDDEEEETPALLVAPEPEAAGVITLQRPNRTRGRW